MTNSILYRPIDPRIPLFKEGEVVLRAIRESLEMSQEQFAREMGCSVSSINRWERGKGSPALSIPQIKQFNRLLRRIGMTVENLPDDITSPVQFPSRRDVA